jgi:hypothetical protein
MTFTETRFLLSERNNPHAPRRANGVRFWGYPTRIGAPRVIGIHTTENDPSPATAENVSRWQAFEASSPSSYHVLVDSDSIVRTIEDDATAFHIVGLNSVSLGLSFGTRHNRWGRFKDWDREALARAAWVAARWSKRWDIPVRWVTLAGARAGQSGFIRHSVADPARRSDPGGGFPHQEFFRLVRLHLDGGTAPEEDDVIDLNQLKSVVREVVLSTPNTVLQERLNEATRLAQAATSAAVASIRADVGLPPDSSSDEVQVARIRAGSWNGRDYGLAEARAALEAAAGKPPTS